MDPSFPESAVPKEKLLEELAKIKKGGVDIYSPTRFRQYSTNPQVLSLEILTDFAGLNWNNIGVHTFQDSALGTRKLERDVISMLGSLLGSKNIDGYITQGGTEGNLMGLWTGRNYLRKKNAGQKIVLLKTSLSHYSVDKVADILDINQIIDVPLEKRGGMSPVMLEEILHNNVVRGQKKFLFFLTLGYNKTGTVDAVNEINMTLLQSKQKMGIEFYVHLDAAIGGLVYPFVADMPFDFTQASVSSITLDMHKTGFMPQTAGVFLCRKGLLEYVARPAAYLLGSKIDASFSGSRPGAVAAASWGVIKALGRQGFKTNVKLCLDLKEYFLLLLNQHKNVLVFSYITSPFLNIAAFSFQSFSGGKLPHSIERKYGLVAITLQKEFGLESAFYTIVFMPHVTKQALCDFVFDMLAALHKGAE